MANFGIQTWDAGGVPNNTGIVKVMVLGSVYMANGQVSGTYSYNIPSGYTVAAVQSPITGESFSGSRRKINAAGSTIKITNASGDYSTGTVSADEGWLIVYLVKA